MYHDEAAPNFAPYLELKSKIGDKMKILLKGTGDFEDNGLNCEEIKMEDESSEVSPVIYENLSKDM